MNTDNVESVARQLSDIYDINILWGARGEENFVEQGSITKHPNRPFHELQDSSYDEFAILYQLDMNWDDAEDNHLGFFYMNIYKDIVEISFMGWPYRSSDYERCFWVQEPPMDEQTIDKMRDFRMLCKSVFGKLDISKIFCFGDSYSVTGFIEETKLGMDWDEFEVYILSGRYLDDTENQEEYHWKDNSMLIYVSDFLTGKNPKRCQGSADIFVDDFDDL